MDIQLPRHTYPGKVGYTFATSAPAGSLGELFGYVSALVSEPAGLAIFGICLCIVAMSIRRRESLQGTAAQSKVISLERAKLEKRSATLGSMGTAPSTLCRPSSSLSASDKFAASGQRHH